MLLKRVMKYKTSFICYFEFHDLYLFTFSRLKSLACPSSTHFAGQLAHVIGPLKCYNDDYQCYDNQCYPCFTLSSAFYCHIRVLPSHPRFTLISVFYPLVRPSVRASVRTSGHPSVQTSVRPSICPYQRFTLTAYRVVFSNWKSLENMHDEYPAGLYIYTYTYSNWKRVSDFKIYIYFDTSFRLSD